MGLFSRNVTPAIMVNRAIEALEINDDMDVVFEMEDGIKYVIKDRRLFGQFTRVDNTSGNLEDAVDSIILFAGFQNANSVFVLETYKGVVEFLFDGYNMSFGKV